MKFTVNREKLQKALQRVGSIIGSRSMFPVLGNVLIQAEENLLTLTTTDLEIRISTTLEAAVEVPGVSTAPARKLTSLIGCFVGSDVLFDIDEKDHIKLKCGTSHFTLLGLAAADFPAAEGFEAKREIRIKEGEFKKMVASIAYAVSADDSRKVLTGVLLSARESTVTLVATDGKRLAMQENTPESITGGDGDAIIPLKAAQEVRRLLDGDEPLTIRLGDKQCGFIGGGFELVT
jgi:DNA polymerase-3 subunit beta